MGELVVGRPALQVSATVSIPLELVSVMSLLYRAVPGSGLDAWLVTTRRTLSPELQDDLDTLHGFSGRLLYYMEEPSMAFEPLREDRAQAPFEEFHRFLDELPADAYLDMARRAINRAHVDIGSGLLPPAGDDEQEWRRYIEPVLTTTESDQALALIFDPALLKRRTIRLITGVWNDVYRDEFERRGPALHDAVAAADPVVSRGFGMAFAELTGNRLPSTLAAWLNSVTHVTFCPSAHLGDFVSYITYPPELVVFFPLKAVQDVQLPPVAELTASLNGDTPTPKVTANPLTGDDLLEAIRAMADANRMRILDLLETGELYAQEIVGRLGIAQSAVSRHLGQLERAGLIQVEPRRGMKYYAINHDRIRRLSEGILHRVP